jgi:hypothetical protein
MHADVYVYNYRMRTIPDGVQSRQVRFAFQRAKREIGIAVQRGYYRRFTRILSGSVRLGKAPDSPRALLYIFGFVGRGGRFISVLAVTGHNQHFLKLRLTYPGRLHRTVGKVMMRRVLRQMGEMIKRAR